MTQRQPSSEPANMNPYELAAEEHGWRGLSISGVGKRKIYHILHNDHVLITGLLTFPGERSVRHSHESGEVSISYQAGVMKPRVRWWPPGMLHGGIPPGPQEEMEELPGLVAKAAAQATGDGALGKLLLEVVDSQRRLKEELERLAAPAPSPRIIVDILFPPFRTTIKDAAYPEKRTVTGQWYD